MASSFSRVRQRVVPRKRNDEWAIGRFDRLLNGNWSFWSNQSGSQNIPYTEGQITADNLHPGPPWKSGGPFKTLRVKYIHPMGVVGQGTYYSHLPVFSGGRYGRYVGGFLPSMSNSTFLNDNEVIDLSSVLKTSSSLFPTNDPWIGQAWDRSKPKLEKANALVSLVELRDLPRMIKTTASQMTKSYWSYVHLVGKKRKSFDVSGWGVPKEASSWFLNQQFGWSPFISDIYKMLEIVRDAHLHIKYLTDLNGKWHKRRANLVQSVSVNQIQAKTNGVLLQPTLSNDWFNGTPYYTIHEEISQNVDVSGMFRFYRPELDVKLEGYTSTLATIERNLTLYGLRVNPANLYRAIPWTWLIDWFVKFSSIMERVTDEYSDGVAAKYLYLMNHQKRLRVFTQTLPFGDGTRTFQFFREIESKERVEADTPFGFGLSWAGFSPWQLAILTALGLSRKR